MSEYERGVQDERLRIRQAVEGLYGLTDDELLSPRALPEVNETWVAKGRVLSIIDGFTTTDVVVGHPSDDADGSEQA